MKEVTEDREETDGVEGCEWACGKREEHSRQRNEMHKDVEEREHVTFGGL